MTDDNKKMCQHCKTETEEDGKEYTWCPVDCLPVGGKFDARVYSYIAYAGGYPEGTTQPKITKALGSSRQQVNRSIIKLLDRNLIFSAPNYFGSISYTTDIEETRQDVPKTCIDTKTVIQTAIQALVKLSDDPKNILGNGYLRVNNIERFFEEVVIELALRIDPELSSNDVIIIYNTIHPIMRKANEVRRHWQKNKHLLRHIKAHRVKADDGSIKHVPEHWAVNVKPLRKIKLTDNEYLQ